VKPLGPGTFAVQFTMGQRGHDLLGYAQALLGPELPAGDPGPVFERALEALVPQLEKRKFAATSRPRAGEPRPSVNPRHIPAHVKRAVWQRDGGRCTFTSESGQRCPARSRLEFDHAQPVARGGEASVASLRLLCASHNAYAAEVAFGAEFMRHKREQARHEARQARARARAQAQDRAPEEARGPVREQAPGEARARARAEAAGEQEQDLIACLRTLGFRAEQARRALEACRSLPGASLEEWVRHALGVLTPAHLRPRKPLLAAT
jgi:hypothetical protein